MTHKHISVPMREAMNRMMRKHSRWLITLGKYAIAAGILFLLFRSDILRQDQLRRTLNDPLLLIGGVSLIVLTVMIGTYRWLLLMRCLEIPIGWTGALKNYYLGIFFNNIALGGFGGDLVRLAYMARYLPGHRVNATLSIIIDRLIGLFSVVLLAVAGALPYLISLDSSEFRVIGWILSGSAVIASLIITWALVSRRRLGISRWLQRMDRGGWVREKLLEVLQSAALLRSHWVTVITSISLATLVQLLLVTVVFTLAHRLGIQEINFSGMVLAVPGTILVNSLPLTPGGLGVGEAAFDQLTRLTVITPQVSGYASVFLMYRFLVVLAALPGFFCYLSYGKTEQDSKTEGA